MYLSLSVWLNVCVCFRRMGWAVLATFPFVRLWTWLPGETSGIDSPLLFPHGHWWLEEWQLGHMLLEVIAESLCPWWTLSQPLLDVEKLLQTRTGIVPRSPSVGAKNAILGEAHLHKLYTIDQIGLIFNHMNLHYGCIWSKPAKPFSCCPQRRCSQSQKHSPGTCDCFKLCPHPVRPPALSWGLRPTVGGPEPPQITKDHSREDEIA